ncbi:MAG: leucyl/phenylalanyl-tRNA--protein transferase [Sideroxydans sp.]
MPFPPVAHALQHPNGLLASGGDLSPPRLLDAYRRGIFPWFSPGESILWWSPDPRMVLFPAEFRYSHSLRKTLRKGGYELRSDCAFERVMRACADRPGQGTWITAEMIDAYCALQRLGHAHSVEVWMNGELAGGLYGVALGGMFYGESMFSRQRDGSKIALAHLAAQWQRWHGTQGLIDCQMYTPHLASLGAREIPRTEFVARVQELINCSPVADFRFEPDLFQ